jgi:hypothetical protein
LAYSALARIVMISFLKRRISVPVWAVLALAASVSVLVYAITPSREYRQAAKVGTWMGRPTVFVCEPRPGERIELGRQVPRGPGAEPDAEPIQITLRMQG